MRAAIREQRASEGWVHKVREPRQQLRGRRDGAAAGAMSAAGPLIASLDERQRESGRNALRAMGGASMF